MTIDDGPLLEQLERSRRLGYLGDGPVVDHVRRADDLARAAGVDGGAVLDLGSGGGVPGLVLAWRRRYDQVVLVDRQARRTAFLRSAVVNLDLESSTRVVTGEAEALAHGPDRGGMRAVFARSFGPPAVTAECAVGFLESGGVLVVAEPPTSSSGPDRWPDDELARLGLRRRREVPSATTAACFELVGVVPADVPRPGRLVRRRPRW